MATFIRHQKKKNRYAVMTLSILVLFLMSLLFFSKRALEPTLHFYTDLYYSQPVSLHPPIIVHDVFEADTGGFFEPSDSRPTRQISGRGPAGNDGVSLEEETNTFNESQFVNGSEGLEPPIQESIMQIAKESLGSGLNGSQVSDENKKKPVYESEFISDPGGWNPPIHEPISDNSEAPLGSGYTGGHVSADDKTKPIYGPESVSVPAGLEPSIQQPISQISENNSVDLETDDGVVAVEENTHPVVDSKTSVKMVDSGGAVTMLKHCDIFMGRWVEDNEYPIYGPGSCPYVDEAYTCQGNGRPDSKYMKWRWKPDGCDLPRYETAALP